MEQSEEMRFFVATLIALKASMKQNTGSRNL